MRQYYHNVVKGKPLMTTKLKATNLHWCLFGALVQGAAGSLCFEDYTDLMISVLRRDVNRLFVVISRIDSYLLSYNSLTSVVTVRVHRQLVSFLKKFPFSDRESPFDRSEAAKNKFLAAEQQCRDTNLRLSSLTREELPRWVFRARQIIFDVLGDLTSEKVMKIISHGKHGPGATTASRDGRVTPYYKYSDFPYTCTKSAMPYALAAISSDPAWIEILESSGRRKEIPPSGAPRFQKEIQIFLDCVEEVDSDNVTFVPKDARTERPIAVGNSLNMYLQLGVKAYMQSRLCAFGIDLSDQSRNQRYAYLGSRYCFNGDTVNPKQFSTIDLASASDTISYELVRLLLPSDWFAFLCDLRHETGILGQETIRYEKFSAMGNGFTFPLETLIFWACSKAALDESGYPSTTNDLISYGDDIICRYEGAFVVTQALVWAGFIVNDEKSFYTGPFKESCGSDYFRGHDVRGFYLKREIKTYEDVYFVCNEIAQKCLHLCDRSDLQSLFQAAVNLIPVGDRRYVPMDCASDCGLRVPLNWIRHRLHGICYLSDEEYHVLEKTGHGVFHNTHDPSYIFEYTVPKEYRGRARIRLYIALGTFGSTLHEHASIEQMMHLEAATHGKITRRGKLTTVTRVSQSSSWNATYPSKSLKYHPIWFTK